MHLLQMENKLNFLFRISNKKKNKKMFWSEIFDSVSRYRFLAKISCVYHQHTCINCLSGMP